MLSYYYKKCTENPCVDTDVSAPFNIRIQHGVSSISVRQIPWEMVKPRATDLVVIEGNLLSHRTWMTC